MSFYINLVKELPPTMITSVPRQCATIIHKYDAVAKQSHMEEYHE
tara:strand:- start:2086 stop:2220 length:135 start_codon:yes stop_codon:yes gene_type:complete